LQHTSRQFLERVELFKQGTLLKSLRGIQHGVERESLRINGDGGIAQTDHHAALGSALTHRFITTDFSESLLEFITQPEPFTKTTLAQLNDIHKYTSQNIGDERLWPLSMPCYIGGEEAIRLANYGTSNVGQMKHLYRRGLKNRYGSMMQTISGVHFNFSFATDMWDEYLPLVCGQEVNQDNISAGYFHLIRNYRRFCWILPYLFGASPTMCQSFLGDKKTNLELQRFGKGSLYLPHATSLRMSDLGYTNSAQSGLQICYNQVDSYIKALRKAIQTPSPLYDKFNGKIDGEFQQLNSNVLQIENELYSPIRPKQPTISLEKPTDALDDRGVSYIEVRVLDVNPFSPVGVSEQQMRFLDVFLLYCLLKPSEPFDWDSYSVTEQNLNRVVTQGRDPELTLLNNGKEVRLRELGSQLMQEMQAAAELLDTANECTSYSEALEKESQCIENPELTLSGQVAEALFSGAQPKDNGEFGLELAEKYRQHFMSSDYQVYSEAFFAQQMEQSLSLQQQIESEDNINFDTFMQQNFPENK